MEKWKERYETPDVEELKGNLFRVTAAESLDEQIEGDVEEEELVIP